MKTEREEELESMCDRLAASVILLAYDAHPVYANTTGWRGGIGGAAMTPGCSIINPPPGEIWAECDMPTSVAREWIMQRDTDHAAIKEQLKAEWTAALTTTPTPAADESGAGA